MDRDGGSGSPAELLITEDLPAIWVERMLFNPGKPVRVLSEIDGVRIAAWRKPQASPHPLRFRRPPRRVHGQQ